MWGHLMLRGVRRAFSLIEILVAISIVGLLVGLTIPAAQRARDAAARVACQSNLRQLAVAPHMAADLKGELPKGCDYPYLTSPRQLDRQCGISWQAGILPFLEQVPTWQTVWDANRDDPGGRARPTTRFAGAVSR